MKSRCKLSLVVLFTASIMLAVGCGTGGDAENSTSGDRSIESPQNGTSNKSTSKTARQPLGDPHVEIETSLGNIVVQLNPQKAELTVSNFLQYVDDHHYDGTIFHDVSKGCAVLGGGYTNDLTQKQDRPPVRNEANNGLKNVRGTIAMVRRPDVIDSATCQFMFNLADNDFLDHRNASTAEGYGYCVFGNVVKGMDVLDKIGSLPVKEVPVADGDPFPRVPAKTMEIRSVRRIR